MTPYTIVTGDFVSTGGMDAANFHLAEYVASAGREVHLVAHRVAPELQAMRGVTWHRVAKPLNSYLLGGRGLTRAGEQTGRGMAGRGGRLVANGGNCVSPDVNWVHYVHAGHPPEIAHSLRRRLQAAWAYRGFVTSERTAVQAARVVVANSERTRRDLIELVHVRADRIHTVYYGADAEYHRPPTVEERRTARQVFGWNDERPSVVFIGALGDRRKGFDLLFAAWRTLSRDTRWPARLVVVGAGSELEHWRHRVAQAGLTRSIQFLGFTRDVRRVLWASDAIVAPARYEAYGLAVHEAVCCGLPAIVSAESGVAERLGALAPLRPTAPESADAVADALHRWHEHRAQWAAVGALASAELRAWSWRDMSARIVELAEQPQ